MRVSKRQINPVLEKELSSRLFQLIADLKTPEEAKIVFSDLLGENERTTFIKRLAVAYWLSQGRGVTNIRENLAVSSATIESIKRKLDSPGFSAALKKVAADVWAERWAEKIRKLAE